MQPRFSPDGKWIAYTSDRDGLWNIWAMKPDGTGAHQVSKEKRWFVNSPTWAPDSQYIYRAPPLRQGTIERGRRDLDVSRQRWRGTAGHREEWLAEGRRRAGVSPDGRFLYYSKDVTPGQTFQYDKNPYGTIYAIIRRDLTNGRERTKSSGPAARSRRASHRTDAPSPSSAACA